jgi:3-isopropylmalate/(R)-2-methylmalate dehydratase small subunit/methanogen homoaconitase small subunit
MTDTPPSAATPVWTPRLTGPALRFGDDVNTDELHPSRFYSLDDKTVRSGFLRAAEGHERRADTNLGGRIVVAGRNFGIGSSRETGARVFLLHGIVAVVAVSFARIFYRNVMNLGLPAFTCPGLADTLGDVTDGAPIAIGDTGGGARLRIGEGPGSLAISPLDPYWEAVSRAGGLEAFLGLTPR